VDGLQRDSGVPDQVCQGRQAQIDAFTGCRVALKGETANLMKGVGKTWGCLCMLVVH
jgi:hypothetical protein